jgi:predicted acetyltransferase
MMGKDLARIVGHMGYTIKPSTMHEHIAQLT